MEWINLILFIGLKVLFVCTGYSILGIGKEDILKDRISTSVQIYMGIYSCNQVAMKFGFFLKTAHLV